MLWAWVSSIFNSRALKGHTGIGLTHGVKLAGQPKSILAGDVFVFCTNQ